MILSLLLAGALVAAPAAAPPAPPVPPVPGLCTAPVPADPETPGCYMTNVVELADAPPMLYWHIREFDAADEAQAEAQRHRWAAVTRILILAPAGVAPVVPGGDWTPGAYCDGGAQADDRP